MINDYFKHQVSLTVEGARWLQSLEKDNVFKRTIFTLTTRPTRENDKYIITQFILDAAPIESITVEVPRIEDTIEESIADFLFPDMDLLCDEKLYRQVEQQGELITFKILDKETFARNMSGLRTDYLYKGMCGSVVKDLSTNKYYLDMDGSSGFEEMRPNTMQKFFDNLLTEEREEPCGAKNTTFFDIDPIKIDVTKNSGIILTLSIEDLFTEEDFSSRVPMRDYTTENGITIYYGYDGERDFFPLISDDQIWFGTGETTIKDTVDPKDLTKIISAWGEFRDYLARKREK